MTHLNIEVDPVIFWKNATTKLLIIWETAILNCPPGEVLEEHAVYESIVSCSSLEGKRLLNYTPIESMLLWNCSSTQKHCHRLVHPLDEG